MLNATLWPRLALNGGGIRMIVMREPTGVALAGGLGVGVGSGVAVGLVTMGTAEGARIGVAVCRTAGVVVRATPSPRGEVELAAGRAASPETTSRTPSTAQPANLVSRRGEPSSGRRLRRSQALVPRSVV